MHHSWPQGSAGQHIITHPRAHGHQKPTLEEPPLQGVSLALLPTPDGPVPWLLHMGPGHTVATGAGTQGQAEQVPLPRLLFLLGERYLGLLPDKALELPTPHHSQSFPCCVLGEWVLGLVWSRQCIHVCAKPRGCI